MTDTVMIPLENLNKNDNEQWIKTDDKKQPENGEIWFRTTSSRFQISVILRRNKCDSRRGQHHEGEKHRALFNTEHVSKCSVYLTSDFVFSSSSSSSSSSSTTTLSSEHH
uniref:Uncharacterized protein n=1 Tax=Trichobilharzia regenti TaxID=157069 RepID=A0AA85J591_TRIRE|nr:unnamed protein product [Trichobilharzia regenti]